MPNIDSQIPSDRVRAENAVKIAETTPPKWADKTDYLAGQYVEHKDIIYLVLVDHTPDKAEEPQNTPEWYEIK